MLMVADPVSRSDSQLTGSQLRYVATPALAKEHRVPDTFIR